MQMAFVMSIGLFSAMIEMTCHVSYFFDFWQWCNFSGIEALEFSFIYTQQSLLDLETIIPRARMLSELGSLSNYDDDHNDDFQKKK